MRFAFYAPLAVAWVLAVLLVLTHRPSMPQPDNTATVQLPAGPLDGTVSPRKTTR